MEKANPFQNVVQELQVEGQTYKFYSLPALNDERVNKLPFSIRVLLESAVRNCDEFSVKRKTRLSLFYLSIILNHVIVQRLTSRQS